VGSEREVKKANKAIVFSVFVFPGAGYFILGATKRAIATFFLTLACLGIVLAESFHKAQFISQRIVDGRIPLDILGIREQIELAPGLFPPGVITAVSISIGVLWIAGIVDAYRLGRLPDNADD
jgi:hypothetical protein